MLSLHPLTDSVVGVELRFDPSIGISSPQSLARQLQADVECHTSQKITSSSSSLSSSKTSLLMRQIASALQDRLLVLIRADPNNNNNNDESDIDLSPEDIRTLYMSIHKHRYPQLQINPPVMARGKWSEENIRGATFPNYNGKQQIQVQNIILIIMG